MGKLKISKQQARRLSEALKMGSETLAKVLGRSKESGRVIVQRDYLERIQQENDHYLLEVDRLEKEIEDLEYEIDELKRRLGENE